VLDIADKGLARRARLNRMGDTEQGFLNPLREIAESGLTNADRMLALYDSDWGGDVSKVYNSESF
jgi:glutamate--cysteine ligase